MLPHEKILKVLEYKNISVTELSKQLKISQSTLNGYFNVERSSKLLPYFWEIVTLFPDINREWLFFDEGEMLKGNNENTNFSSENSLSFKRECELLHSQLADKNKIIALYEKRELDARKNFTDTNNALGTGNAALLSHQGSEESQ